MDVEPPDRRTVVRRRRHRPPVITGDGIEYPPAPYTFEARVGTMGFLARQLRRRAMPIRPGGRSSSSVAASWAWPS